MSLEGTHAANAVVYTVSSLSPKERITGAIGFAPGSDISCVKHQSEGPLVDKSLDEASKTGPHNPADDLSAAQKSRAGKKAKPVRSACLQCKKRKTKCSGQRPICQSCKDCVLDCLWEVPEGLTRMEGLREKLQSVTNRVDNLEALVGRMRDGTDEESTMLLATLRLGWSVEEMAHAIRTGPAHEEEVAKKNPP